MSGHFEQDSGSRRTWRAPRTPEPRVCLAASPEELTALDGLLRDHLETLVAADTAFRQYLGGTLGSREWDEAFRVATRSRVAYERKRDAILVRTGRV